ncbi:MAG: type II toxin-antitoxin system RelE/ParE family toxin [Prevotella sp.]|nr:type II toxin-antitoxin system RelE/ParE family toxin [Prevotella sp.]
MAQVKWQKRAENELYRYLVKGFLEFGETTANKFTTKVALINDDLMKFPEAGFPEPLLKDRKKLYRARHIVGRLKLIYYYSKSSDTVHVADIWDTRREPSALAKRIR